MGRTIGSTIAIPLAGGRNLAVDRIGLSWTPVDPSLHPPDLPFGFPADVPVAAGFPLDEDVRRRVGDGVPGDGADPDRLGLDLGDGLVRRVT
jgi:hypothetical protein